MLGAHDHGTLMNVMCVVANRSEAASISQPQDTVVESARWSDWEGPAGWRQKVHLRLLYHVVLPTREYALTGLAWALVRPLLPRLLSNIDQALQEYDIYIQYIFNIYF